jgi:hypothetical protein
MRVRSTAKKRRSADRFAGSSMIRFGDLVASKKAVGRDPALNGRPSGFFLRSPHLGVDAGTAMLTAADTAYATAFMRALEKERPASERLFEDPYAALFSAGGAHASEGTSRFLQLPFVVDAVRLRTRFIDDFLREGLASGVGQVVLLGAGFDTRGLRLPEIAACRASVYEVDFAWLQGLTIRCSRRSARAASSKAKARCSFGKGSSRISMPRRSTPAFDSW